AEQRANRLVREVVEGEYLQVGDMGKTVVGRAFLKRLKVELGDLLMVTIAGADGEMRSAMLEISGVVKTGSSDLDASICHVTLAQAEELSGIAGAGEITMLVDDPDLIPRIQKRIAAGLPEGDAVVAWDEIFPELASGVEVDETFTRLTVGIVVTVVFLGIASAQLAAVLERRREFAVLSALGMKGFRLVRVMMLEGVILGLFGTLAGLAVGVPSAYYLARWGIDFSAFYADKDLTMSNILVDPIIFGDFGWWLVPLALGIAMTATLLSSLYPAWYAVKTDPAQALRVDH
ncbi:MAG TPA: ABC transporter permease, partial [Candidatus Hydrogenedentes bacterium]|nr:ABC transporter permease [Candidatus Hydrogenedentota bacterium]